MNLTRFLSSKPLTYAHFDPKRMVRVWESIRHLFTLPKIVRIVGTNGKGTTGRYLARILQLNGYDTAHYTSPHIFDLSERFWKNGELVETEEMEHAHARLLTYLAYEDAEALSYFEYTTLLAVALFEQCDYIVLETGLGGEYDATNVFPVALLLVTPIDFDHKTFLGETIEEIATTKLEAIASDLILGVQHHPQVVQIAREIAEKRGFRLNVIDPDHKLLHATFLEQNRALAKAAADYLGLSHDFPEASFEPLFGRLSKIAPNITVDVGHNPLAAFNIKTNLGAKKVILIYNTFDDKEYEQILHILKESIIHVEVLPIEDERIVKEDTLIQTLEKLEIEHKPFKTIDESSEYLVFGSFKTVETFCKRFYS